MYASNFEYDGRLLSDFGFIICEFNGSGDMEIKETGYNITFNKVERNRGRVNGLAGTRYDDCVRCSFQICKNPEEYEDPEISNDEYRNLARWLNRHEFHRFRMLCDENGFDRTPCWFNASFNVEKIYVGDRLCGLQLTAETDAPYGYGETFDGTWTVGAGEAIRVLDISDDSGFTRPDLTITCRAAGTMKLSNPMCDSEMIIKNCTNGEVIHVNGSTQIVTTSMPSHKIYNDFNFDFLKIGNVYGNRLNTITSTLPCTIRISYTPTIKDIP